MDSSPDGAWPQRSELRSSLAEGPGDVFPSRRDTAKAARVFELVGQPDAAPPPSRPRLATALAGAVGIIVGLLLALLLAHTAFAPDRDCEAKGATACAHAAR